MQADVALEKDAEALVAAAVKRFGGVDVLVNNAGMGLTRRREESLK